MENFNFFGGKLGWFCFFLGIVLLFGCANAKENTTWPTANLNLGPIQKWRSSYYCLKYIAPNGPCNPKDVLTPGGNLSVSKQDLDVYCGNKSCADHIRFEVLKCIYLVMRNDYEFHFVNSATIKTVNDTINHACATKSGDLTLGNLKKNSGIKVYQKWYMSLVPGVLVFLAMFNM